MELYLMQHGACLPGEVDPDQPLSPLGREVVELSAAAMAALGLRFDLILSSPKTRSAQTAAIVATALGYPERNIHATDAVKAMAPPEDLARMLAERKALRAVFVAGHLPSLGRIAGLYAAGDDIRLGIKNGGLTRVDITSHTPPEGNIAWQLPPKLLHLTAR